MRVGLGAMCALILAVMAVPAMAEQAVAQKFEQGYGAVAQDHGTVDKAMSTTAEASRLRIAGQTFSSALTADLSCGKLPSTQTAKHGTKRMEVASFTGSKRTGKAIA